MVINHQILQVCHTIVWLWDLEHIEINHFSTQGVSTNQIPQFN